MTLALDVIQSVKDALFTRLNTEIDWAHLNASLLEVTEFTVPPARSRRTIQVLFSAEPSGQAGGLYLCEVTVSFAAVIRFSQDSLGRIDLTMKEARNRLAEVQGALEGQGLDFLEIPLHTDVGPTQPDIVDVSRESQYGFSFLQMSGTKHQTWYGALGISDDGSFDPGYS